MKKDDVIIFLRKLVKDPKMQIDIEKLRSDLIYYYGVVGFRGMSVVMMDVFEVEDTFEEELIKLAKDAGWDLRKYKVDEYER